jgi:hypothetical protein
VNGGEIVEFRPTTRSYIDNKPYRYGSICVTDVPSDVHAQPTPLAARIVLPSNAAWTL